MQEKNVGLGRRADLGFRGALGEGPALRALLVSAAALVAGCDAQGGSSAGSRATGAAGDARVSLGRASAALVTNAALSVTGDTFVRQGLPDLAAGSAQQLSLQSSSVHRTLLFFDADAIRAAVGSGTILTARIDLLIATNGGGWGTGRQISIHPLRQASAESATWSCAADGNPFNQEPDCSGDSAWAMSGAPATLPFVPEATSTFTVTNGTQGAVSLDVTQDVLALLAGTWPGHGWLIKKVDEAASGALRFTSREQGVAPRVTLTFDDPNLCNPTAITDETCDGVDDDCDGDIDDDVPAVETSCGSGACAAVGMLTCVGGQLQDSCAVGIPGALDASCDGVDDDCDGLIDDDYVPPVTSCGVGACGAQGAARCVDGAVIDDCQPGEPAAADASCDGVDDDCDGVTDEDFSASPTSCGLGACSRAGSTSCAAGLVVDDCTPGPAAASDATCDGVDDDCDGAADEDFALTCAGASTLTCVTGAPVTTPCSDGNACNGEESCTGAAVCVAGVAPVADDDNPCTVDACDPSSGVVHTPLAAGSTCGHYRECTVGGQCVNVLPPAPSEVAPELAAGNVSFLDRVRYLFEGEAPIQRGVAPGAISSRSAALLRGRVLDASGAPLPRVTVSVHGHPELGSTLSRLDGAYDLVVNGGAAVTLRFTHADAFEVQRTVRAPWQDYESLDDVALRLPDASASVATFPGASPLVHSASVVEDARGERRARLFLPEATGALVRHPDGSEEAVASLSLRASELGTDLASVGLPALLPQTAAAVYAVELSADEARAAGASAVDLSQPASVYVENFPKLPAGTPLPVATYDRERARWVGGAEGRVLFVLDASTGAAVLDVDGSGAPAPAEALAALGISSAELGVIAELFAAGRAFFRVTSTRLGPLAVGLPFRAGVGAGGSAPSRPAQQWPLDDGTLPPAAPVSGVLSESLPLLGTPFTLTYRSDRVLGDRRGQHLQIDATGASVAGGLLGARVDVQIAGQRSAFSLPPVASGVVDFTWDGRDEAGRVLHGWQRARIRVGALYSMTYREPEVADAAFAHTAPSGGDLGQAPQPLVRWTIHERLLHTFDSRQTGIGAWTLDEHHHYDPVSRVVYRGDGTAFPTRTSSTLIERYAGLQQAGQFGVHDGDGGPALDARMDGPRSVAVGSDGAVYVGTRRGVRRVSPDGASITTVAGGASNCSANLISGQATAMCVHARTIDFAPDGTLIIADNPTGANTIDRIRRLDLATGQISHVAGVRPNSGCTNRGDGGLARDAALCNLTAHATGLDGSIYVLDRGVVLQPPALRKISTDGTIETIGSPSWSAADDSAAVAVGPDGSVYVAVPRMVQRYWPSGEVTHFAGDLGNNGSSGEGGPATLARFGNGGPSAVTVGPDGRVFIGDSGNAQLRMVDQLGIIRRVAGTTPGSASGDGGSPLAATLGLGVFRSVVAPDGAVFLTPSSSHNVRVVRPGIAGNFSGEAWVPAPEGGEMYRFSAEGRHLETLRVPSGEQVYAFGYDAQHLLTSVTDAEGQVTLIERDEDGTPVQIVAPGGETTLLDSNGNGYLATVMTPGGEVSDYTYDEGGLLTQRIDPAGDVSVYTYAPDGRLLVP